MMNIKTKLVMAALCTMVVSISQARVISWQVAAYSEVNYPQTAGIVPATYWNNTWDPANGGQNNPVAGWVYFNGFKDSTGAAVNTAVGSPSFALGWWQYKSILGDIGAEPDGNTRLMNGLNISPPATLGTPSTMNVYNIPYTEYDVYVYMGCESDGRQGTVSVAGTTYDFTSMLFAAVSNDQAVCPMVQTTSTTGAYPSANWCVISNLNSETATIVVQILDTSAFSYGGVCGFQIVEDTNVPCYIENLTPHGGQGANPVISADVIDNTETFQEAVLSLNGTPYATNNTPDGTTNTISYSASGLTVGTYTAEVSVVTTTSGGLEAVSRSWTFDVVDYVSITHTPGWWEVAPSTNPTVEITIVEAGATVNTNLTKLFIDGVDTGAVADRSGAPTTTISFTGPVPSNGWYGARLELVDAGTGDTNVVEWTFGAAADVLDDPATLVHRWNFNEGGGTNVLDTVGSATGTVVGANHAWIAGGLDLFGGGIGNDWNAASTNYGTAGSYVKLPAGLISAFDTNAMTFEVTYILDTTDGQAGGHLVDFGQSVAGEGETEYGLRSFNISPVAQAGDFQRVSAWMGDDVGGGLHQDLDDANTAAGLAGSVIHLVYVFTPGAGPFDGYGKLFVNGEVVDARFADAGEYLGDMSFNEENCWLGRSQWGNPMFDGKLLDVRMYQGVMTASEVADQYVAALKGIPPQGDIAITSISHDGTDATVEWTTTADPSYGAYSILKKSALTAGSWTPVVSNMVPPPSGMGTNTVDGSATAAFFTIEGVGVDY